MLERPQSHLNAYSGSDDDVLHRRKEFYQYRKQYHSLSNIYAIQAKLLLEMGEEFRPCELKPHVARGNLKTGKMLIPCACEFDHGRP